jgi:hypothetical protein
LTGVVFGTPTNVSAAAAGIAPVFVNLDNITGGTNADLVTANVNGSTGSVSILPGNANGTFGTATATISLDFLPLTIQDGVLGTNSKIDLVVGSTNSNHVGVITQNINGLFTETDYVATGLSDTQSVAIGDFNGDNHLDFAVASLDAGTTNNVAIFLNNGSGGFTLSQVLSVPHSQLASLTTFSAGTKTDLAVADAGSAKVTTLLNTGTGVFTIGTDYTVGATPVTIKAGQFNSHNNANDDLVTADSTGGTVSVLLGNGNGTFQTTAVTTPISGVPTGGGPLKVRVANLNNDGLPDLICLLSSGSSGDAAVLLGNGDGTFHVGNVFNAGSSPITIAAGDLNGDGLTDVTLASQSEVTSLINNTNQDTTPPTAAVDVTQPIPVPGSATIDFTVTYSDALQIDTTSFQSANITVTSPGAMALPVTLVSTGLVNGPTETVTYSVPAPSGSLSTADNGAYTVTATGNAGQAVKNADGLTVAGGQIGVFNLVVPVATNSNGPNLVANTVRAILRATTVAGTHSIGGATVTLVNAGNQVAKGTIIINLYASPDQTIRGDAPRLSTVTRRINLRVGGRAAFAMPGWFWPATLNGTLFLVANVNATGSVAETTYADNTALSATSTNVQLPFVDIQNLWPGRLPPVSEFMVGHRIVVPVLIRNLGNVTARNTATATVLASTTHDGANPTTLGTVLVRVAVPANLRQALLVALTMPSTLVSGTPYYLIIDISYPSDTNAGNDTAVSTTTFTAP